MKRLLAIAAVTLVASGCGSGGDAPALPEGQIASTSVMLAPNVHLFGDDVAARVDVVVDRERLDPDRVRLDTGFDPYERVGDVRRTRRDYERFTHFREEVTLRCLRYDCIGERLESAAGEQESGHAERRTFRFEPVQVVYDDPESGKERVIQNAKWPPLESVSRINVGAVSLTTLAFGGTSPFTGRVTPLPGVSLRAPSALVASVFLGLALALLTIPVLVVRRQLRARRPPPVEPEQEQSPLESALALVEWARDRADVRERRESLEVLAVELEARSWPDLATSTRRVAWAHTQPSPVAMGDVAARVKERDGDSG